MNVFFDTLNAEQTLTRMEIQIRDVGHELIPLELTNWQTQDMKRKFPNTEEPNYVSAETTIWPRSRTYEKVHRTDTHRFIKRRHTGAAPRLIARGGKLAVGHRPILRPELLAKLIERMDGMLSVNLKWVTSHTAGAQAPTSGFDRSAQARRAMLQPSNLNI